MVKNVIFDIGKVLIYFDWMEYMRKNYDDEEVIEKITTSIWNSGWWPEMDRGVMPEEEIMSNIIKEAATLGVEEQAKYTLYHFAECMDKQDYAIPWVKELKAKGYKVYFLSNYSDFLVRIKPEILDFRSYMDGGVFSYEEGLIKPDAAIYNRICEKYNLIPQECIFTDDIQKNIDAARACGMKGLRFDGYETAYPLLMNYLESGDEKYLSDKPAVEIKDGINWNGWKA